VASVSWHSSGRWIATIRPVFPGRDGKGRIRRRSVRLKGLGPDDRDQAQATADHMEHLARLCEDAPKATTIAEARELKAISPDQAEALLAGELVPEAVPQEAPKAVTITDCYHLHLSTRRAEKSSQREAVRHLRELHRFLDWAQQQRKGRALTSPGEVTLDLVMDYVDHLKRQGLAWDSRRHCLVAIRRATNAAAAFGHTLFDPLYKQRIDPRGPDEWPQVEVWTWDELRAAIGGTYTVQRRDRVWGSRKHGRQASEREERRQLGARELAVLGLGGFMGLRPSEICAVQAADIEGDILTTGRKTPASRRWLPIPPTVRGWLQQLVDELDGDDVPLVHAKPVSARGGRVPFQANPFATWCRGWLPQVTGRELPPKALRKSFATGLIWDGIEERLVEAYLGHGPSRLTAVTLRSYLQAARARELWPIAEHVEELITNGPAVRGRTGRK
jgi:integrase